MANQYDFNPRVTPLSGLSLSDLINAKRSALTTAALSTPPILEALRQRALLQQQQNAQAQFLSGLSNPALASGEASLTPDQMVMGIRSGILDQKGALELSPVNQAKRRAEIDKLKADAEYKRRLAQGAVDANGNAYALIEDPISGKITVQMIPGVPGKKGGGPVSTMKTQLSPEEEARQQLMGVIKGAKEIKKQRELERGAATQQQPGLLDRIGNKLFGSSTTAQAPGPNQIQFSYELNGQTLTATAPAAQIKAAQQRVAKQGGKNFRIGK